MVGIEGRIVGQTGAAGSRGSDPDGAADQRAGQLDRLMAGGSALSRFQPATRFHTVAAGETLSGIAEKAGTDWPTLARINGIADPDRIRVGQRIELPEGARSTHVVRAGETLSGIAAATGTSVTALAAANRTVVRDADRIFPGQTLALPGRQASTPAPAGDAAAATTTTTGGGGRVDLDRLLDASQGSQAPAARVIGAAEGTRRADGSFTAAYGAHVDPGNNAQNRGSFSLQGPAARGLSPEQADRHQLGVLAARRPAYEAAVRAAGLDPANATLATGYFDLYNQSPSAAGRFLDQVGYLGGAGISTQSVTELRVRSFVDQSTGERFPLAGGGRAGSGFVNIARTALGRTPSEAEVQATIRADQGRRMGAMEGALATLSGTAPASAPAPAAPAGGIGTILPASGEGYVTYNREGGGADQVGTAGFVAGLQAIGRDWAATGNPAMQVGDMSRAGGGRFAPHSAHQRGNEADLRPFRTDGREAPVRWQDAGYDRATTRALVETIRARQPDAVILFNDPQLVREGLVRPYAGHDNHLHIRF